VLRRVFEQGAYADRALHAEAARLAPRDRALAMKLIYGTVQRRLTIDHVASRLLNRPIEGLDPPVLTALRLGLFQLLLLDGVAEHAAVSECVELAKPRGATLVNAVLRRAATAGREILAGLDDATPERAAVLHSVPGWLAELWFTELGAESARALMRRCNEPAEAALRINTLVAEPVELRRQLPVRWRPADGIPEGVVLEEAFDAHASSLFEAGAIMPQSRASMLVSRTLSPQPGERVLDLCAAPGGKTTHLAALIGNRGRVLAVERHPGRASALRRTCRRMRASCAEVLVGDAVVPLAERFDRVLVDPPCSGLGTLQGRPDLRWRASLESIEQLAELQLNILCAAARCLERGGALVYSVCTISRRESEQVIESFLRSDPHFRIVHQRQLLPHVELTDGFFVALLRRQA
jgi:16S rRNA (cytosine967-C5)-methyltransferase